MLEAPILNLSLNPLASGVKPLPLAGLCGQYSNRPWRLVPPPRSYDNGVSAVTHYHGNFLRHDLVARLRQLLASENSLE